VANFDYELLVQKSLKVLICDILKQVEKDGLTNGHHFYITFATNRNNVKVPDFIRKKYPEEMTIVIQHQYWDLKVTDKEFAITLSFSDEHQQLIVPFDSIISFLDPSVKFGLRFVLNQEQPQLEPKAKSPKGPNAQKGSEDNVVTLDQFRKK